MSGPGKSRQTTCRSGSTWIWRQLDRAFRLRRPCVVEIRDATSDDAEAACAVVRQSISQLCVADHRNDPAILNAWLANKQPEIVAAWVNQPGNSLLIAVEGSA